MDSTFDSFSDLGKWETCEFQFGETTNENIQIEPVAQVSTAVPSMCWYM
jgi:hypothetical protein